MRILLLGASGYVGGGLWSELSQRHEVVATSSSTTVPGAIRLDLRDHTHLREVVRDGFDLILHAAGVVDLRIAEADPDLTHEVNVAPLEVIQDAVSGTRTKVLFLSTDNVFDGTAETYTEDHPRSPVNAYGRSKCAAEDVLQADDRHLVVRIPLVYGRSPWADRFLARFSAPVTRAQTDVVCAPLYLPALAPALERLWDASGVLHLGGSEVVTRFELMSRVAKALDMPTEIVGVRNDEAFPELRRPKRLVLRSVRHDLLGPDLDEAIADLSRQVDR